MPIQRVTQQLMVDRVLADLRNQTRDVLRLQRELATGRRVNAPSDDPIDARRAVNTRNIIQKSEQYMANIAMTRPQHEDTATVIQQAMNSVQRVRELTLQGANGANSPDQLALIAEEIDQLLEDMVELGNHRTNGRYIFAGTRTSAPAFEATRDAVGEITAVTYAGNTDSIELAVSDTSRIRLNEPGNRVFQGSADVFQTLVSIRDNLRSADYDALANARLEELENIRRQMLAAVARTGAAQNRVDRTENQTEDYSLANAALLSLTVEADFAETVVNLNAGQNAYQAALSAAGRVLQPSLLDYLS